MVGKELKEKYQGRTALLEHEVKDLLRGKGLPVPRGLFIRTGEPLPRSLDLRYPLVAKVSSAKLPSKSDVKGVRLGLGDYDELRDAVAELMTIRHAEGVLVEEMLTKGLEVIVGGVVDSQFGPVVMFGLGGVFVELYQDVAFALAPMGRDDALWLIRQVKGARLLEGYRGNPPADTGALADILIAVSEIMAGGQVEEIDLNPVALCPEGAMILDAKMLLRR